MAFAAPAASADETGGVTPGQPVLTATPAYVGSAQQLSGTLGPGAGGRRIAIRARTAAGEWATISRVRAARDGTFQTSWRATATGRWKIRAELAAGAVAATATAAPSTTATVYRRATATWYSLPGSRTACGVRLRKSTIGVAHRTLPCGMKVDVTWGGRTLRVPVIDRGPFVSGVHYDLTLAAANRLGFTAAGRVRLGVLPLRPGRTADPLAALVPALSGGAIPAS